MEKYYYWRFICIDWKTKKKRFEIKDNKIRAYYGHTIPMKNS